jgi:hypothetical protein
MQFIIVFMIRIIKSGGLGLTAPHVRACPKPHQINDHKHTMSYKDGDPDPGLGQARTCGAVKPNSPLKILV